MSRSFAKARDYRIVFSILGPKKYEQGDLSARDETSFIPVALDHGHDREVLKTSFKVLPKAP